MPNDGAGAARRVWLRNRLLTSASAIGGLAVLAGPASADEVAAMFRAASVDDRNDTYFASHAYTTTSLDHFAPLWSDCNTLLFADLSGTASGDDVVGSATFGLRTRIAPDTILGFTGSIEREYSDSGASFQGITIGAELLTPTWDLHARAILPDDDWSLASPVAEIVGFGEDTRIRSSWERALPGAEFEVGYTFAEAQGFDLRVFGGAFAFGDGETSVVGPKAGVEARITSVDVFGMQGELSLSGEAAWDAERDTTGYVGFHLTVPFGASGTDTRFGDDAASLFESRVRRGLNTFVTANTEVLSIGYIGRGTDRVRPRPCEPNPRKGIVCDPFTVWYADKTGNGNGSFADPESLPDAISLAGANGIVVAVGNDGAIQTTGVTLLNGQQLVGGGTSVTATVLGQPVTAVVSGTRGTINGTNAANDIITLGDDNRIQNLNFGGVFDDAIFGQLPGHLILEDLDFGGIGGAALYVHAYATVPGVTTVDIDAHDLQIAIGWDDNYNYDIDIRAGAIGAAVTLDFDASFDEIGITLGSDFRAVSMLFGTSGGAGAIVDVALTDSDISADISFSRLQTYVATGSGMNATFIVTDNTFDDSSLSVSADGAGTPYLDVDISDNDFQSSSAQGIDLYANGNADVTGFITGNTIDQDNSRGSLGIQLRVFSADASMDLTLSNNAMTDTGVGFAFYNSGFMDIDGTGNSVTNAGYGFSVFNFDTGDQYVDLSATVFTGVTTPVQQSNGGDQQIVNITP